MIGDAVGQVHGHNEIVLCLRFEHDVFALFGAGHIQRQ